MTSTNELTRQTTIKATRSRVWEALTNHEQFGTWFGVRLEAPFVAGQDAKGRMTKMCEGLELTLAIDRIEPESYFSFYWHPYAIDQSVDYSSEKKTLVEFRLSETPEGTRIEVTESGFDHLPKHRYSDAFRSNGQGWTVQIDNIKTHVEAHARKSA